MGIVRTRRGPPDSSLRDLLSFGCGVLLPGVFAEAPLHALVVGEQRYGSGLTLTFGSAFTSGTRPPLGATKDL